MSTQGAVQVSVAHRMGPETRLIVLGAIRRLVGGGGQGEHSKFD